MLYKQTIEYSFSNFNSKDLFVVLKQYYPTSVKKSFFYSEINNIEKINLIPSTHNARMNKIKTKVDKLLENMHSLEINTSIKYYKSELFLKYSIDEVCDDYDNSNLEKIFSNFLIENLDQNHFNY